MFLITGGCGFLGSNLAASLLELGKDVTVFDNLYRRGSSENLAWLNSLGLKLFTHGDIRSPDDVSRLLIQTQPATIFHLAGQVAMTTSVNNPRMDFEINALGTLNILEAMRLHVPDAALVYSSTNKVYGDLEYMEYEENNRRYILVEHPEGLKESTPLDFKTPYGCSKGSADQYVRDYAKMFGLNTVVFRHSSIYGSRQFATADQGWVGWFCHQALQQKQSPSRFTVSGTGKQVRDVLFAQDAVQCYLQAGQNAAKYAGEVFNIGGGISNSLSLLELFDMLEQTLGISLEYEHLPERQSDQKVFVADISKVQRTLGWTPLISSHEGVLRTLNWLEQTGKL